MDTFKVGSTVKWVSQSSGYYKEKEGVIIQIVKAGEKPNPGFLRTLGIGFGLPRNHTSYLIRIGNIAYWPLVRHLKLVK